MTVFQNVRKGLIPARLTVAEVYALQEQGVIDEREHFELIDGEIVPMAAAKFNAHEWMKSALVRALVPATKAPYGVFVEASLTLSEDTLVEPDLAVWPRDRGTQNVRPQELLLLIEVASSSISYDLRVKARLYARAGVPEYWVVDAIRKTIRVHKAPRGGTYADVEEYEAHDSVTAAFLPSLTVQLDALD